jgi:hypothetical protein
MEILQSMGIVAGESGNIDIECVAGVGVWINGKQVKVFPNTFSEPFIRLGIVSKDCRRFLIHFAVGSVTLVTQEVYGDKRLLNPDLWKALA